MLQINNKTRKDFEVKKYSFVTLIFLLISSFCFGDANNGIAVISWSPAVGATSYLVEIYDGSGMFNLWQGETIESYMYFDYATKAFLYPNIWALPKTVKVCVWSLATTFSAELNKSVPVKSTSPTCIENVVFNINATLSSPTNGSVK